MVTPIFRIDGLPVARLVALAYVLLKIAHDVVFPFEPLRITSAVRTRDEQIAIFTKRYRRGAVSPWGDYRKYQGVWWGRISAEGPVASPDAVSNHTRGYALDLNIASGTARQAWMLRNAPRFGFHWTEGESVGEPWHWTWAVDGIFPTSATPDPWGGAAAPTSIDPSDYGYGDYNAAVRAASGGAPASIEEDDMPLNDDDKKYLEALLTRHIESVPPKVWNHGIGQDGKKGNNQPAWVRLSWAHADGAVIRVLVQRIADRVGGSVKAGFATLTDQLTKLVGTEKK